VCDACIEAGRDGLNNQIEEHVYKLERQLQWLYALRREAFIMPTMDELKKARDKFDSQLRDEASA
jgi:hypothetical protein